MKMRYPVTEVHFMLAIQMGGILIETNEGCIEIVPQLGVLGLDIEQGVINAMESVETSKSCKNHEDQRIDHLYRQIDELEAVSLEKDHIISQLSELMSKSTQELEMLRKELAQKDLEISHLQQEISKLKPYLEGELDSIKQGQSFESLLSSLNVLIDSLDCERVDKILFHICENSLVDLTDKQLVSILYQLENYLQSQFERDRYSAVGVYNLMKSVYSQHRTLLLKDFVETNRPYLEEIFFKVDKSRFNFQESFALLKIYFELELDEEADLWLAEIFRSVVLRDDVQKNDAVELLYLSVVYEHEDEAYNFLPEFQELMKDDFSFEIQVFKVYHKANQHQKKAKQALNRLTELIREPLWIRPQLKVRAYEQMVQRLEIIAEEETYKF